MRGKLGRIEAVRGFAALYVFAGHALVGGLLARTDDLSYLLRFGQEAVMVFFLISGFVIELSFQRNLAISFRDYIMRRWTRVYPILVLALILGWMIQGGNDASRSWRVLLGNLMLLQDLEWAKPGVSVPVFAGNQPLWSLSYEWWFYMAFFPLRTLLGDGARLWVVAVLGVLGLLVTLIAPCQPAYFALYLPVWWLGCEICRFHQGLTNGLPMVATAALILGLVGALTLHFHLHRGSLATLDFGYYPGLIVRHLLASVAFAVLAFAWRKVNWAGFRTVIQPFALIAPFSYGLYLLHFPLVVQWKPFSEVPNPWVWALVATSASVVLAVLAEGPYPQLLKAGIRHLFPRR